MNDARANIVDLHAAYVQLTGFSLPLSMDREAAWFEWVKRGFTPDDLAALVKHHKWLAKSGIPARSLKFRSLVVNVDYAEEDLAEIRARSRVPPPKPNREEVLRATGRVAPDGAPEPVYAKPSEEIIQQLRKAAGL